MWLQTQAHSSGLSLVGSLSLGYRVHMEDVETHFEQTIQMKDGEESDNFNLDENGGQTLEDDPEHHKSANINDGDHESNGSKRKGVHEFYFVRFWPINIKDGTVREAAEELLHDMDQDLSRIHEQTRETLLVQERLESIYRHGEVRMELDCKRNQIIRLQSANGQVNRGRGGLHGHELAFRMQHGCNNMAEEKKLLRKISGRHQKTILLHPESLEVLDHEMGYGSDGKYRNEEELLKDARRIGLESDKTVDNADVRKGKIRGSIESKQSKKKQLKVASRELEELWKRQLEIRRKINRVKRKITSLQKRMEDAQQIKDEAYECILKLNHKYNEENVFYYQNLEILEEVRQLAEKKDIEVIAALSHRQVDEFMSQWNKSKAFRDDYVKRIFPSLERRLLNKDGRLRNAGEKPLFLEKQTEKRQMKPGRVLHCLKQNTKSLSVALFPLKF